MFIPIQVLDQGGYEILLNEDYIREALVKQDVVMILMRGAERYSQFSVEGSGFNGHTISEESFGKLKARLYQITHRDHPHVHPGCGSGPGPVRFVGEDVQQGTDAREHAGSSDRSSRSDR